MKTHQTLGEYIASRRKELGKSQATVAMESDLSPSHYSQIERGKIELPGPETRRRLAAALRTTHLELLVAAGELLPDELPVGGESSPPFPLGTDAAQVVDLMREMSDWELGEMLHHAETLQRLSQKSREGASVGARTGRAVS